LITITRRLASVLRGVLRRAFGGRGLGPAVCFTAAQDTLSVRASSFDAASEYRGPGTGGTADTLCLPFQFLDDCQGRKDEPVHVEVTGTKRATAQWRDGSVPQIVQYDLADPPSAGKFPGLPETFAENPPGILQALTDAGEGTDPYAARYALGCLQLRGQQGSISSTDGRQLLIQSGFHFPWPGDILVPRSKVFASAELPRDQPVMVGKTEDWIAFRTGPWTIWLSIEKDGRFPDLHRQVPQPDAATARCRLSPADAEFLVHALPRLPCEEEFNYPITLDLNGQIAIRAKAADQPKVTEAILTGSELSGEPIRVNMNRNFLARAVKLGFRELLIYGDKIPVLCQEGQRQYVWAVLGPETAVPPPKDPIRIESGQAATNVLTPKPRTRRRTSTVSQPTNNSNGNGNGQPPANGQAARTNGQARRIGRKPSREDVAGLIRQAEATRTVLRDALVKTNELVKALKQHGRRNRAIQNTLASLRQLKTLGV
jgi:hypothetical protein